MSGARRHAACGPRRWLVAAALASGLAAPRAWASPLELFGYGGRAPGLAGSGQTTAAGFDSCYLNPAGLSEVPRKRLTVGYLLGDFDLTMDGASTGTERPAGMMFGAALPVPLGGALADRVGLGLAFFVPSQSLTRVRVPAPGDPVFALLETRSKTIGIMVAAGLSLNDRWRIGAGFLALAALRGSIDVDVDGAGRFSTDSEQKLVSQFAPILGATFDVNRDLRLGLTVRGVSRSEYNIEVTNDLASALPLSLPTLRIAGVAQYDPLTADIEASLRLAPPLRVFGQLSYQRWSAYPLPTQNPIASAPPQESPDFHDTVRPHLGAEFIRPAFGGQLALRAGYAFLWSPAGEMKRTQSLLDNHRHVLSIGTGLDLGHHQVPLYIDLYLQYHHLVARRHVKDPAAFGPDMPLPFESIDTAGRIVVGGATVGVDL